LIAGRLKPAVRGDRSPALRPAAAARLLAVVLLPLAGCGYSTGSLMPEGVGSIAVPMAENDTFYRGDEFAYTRYLSRELIRKTTVRVCECERADAILRVRLVSLRRAPLVEGRDDVVLEEGLVGAIEVRLAERRSGRTIAAFRLERRSEAVLPVGEDLALIRDRLMLELAEDTVVRLQDHSFLAARGYGAADTRPGR
jgi:hypothetical protein